MSALFLEYARCGTCRKAKKWLDEHQISYTDRPMLDNPPTQYELNTWIKKSGLPVKRFFNTSGLLYKELGLKDKLGAMNDQEMIALLSTDGKLVKRPLWIDEQRVLVGFKEEEWQALLK